MTDFDGRTVLVAGVSGGIGGATVRRLVAAGADVIASSRSEEALGALAGETGARVLPFDLTSEDSGAMPRVSAGAVDRTMRTLGLIRVRRDKAVRTTIPAANGVRAGGPARPRLPRCRAEPDLGHRLQSIRSGTGTKAAAPAAGIDGVVTASAR